MGLGHLSHCHKNVKPGTFRKILVILRFGGNVPYGEGKMEFHIGNLDGFHAQGNLTFLEVRFQSMEGQYCISFTVECTVR